ncbi:hypothetical protein RKD35_001903 [Streptomyces albogriseolus]
MQPTCAARSSETPHARPDRKPARKASPTPVGVGLALLVGAGDLDDRLAGPLDAHAAGAEGGDAVADLGEDLLVGPAGLRLDEALLVLVGEEVRGPLQQYPDLLPVHAGDLLGEVGGEGNAPRAALLGVPEHRLRVVGTDGHQVEAAHAVGDGLQLDQPGLAHRARVEGADLVVVGVRGAHEAGGVQRVRDADGVGVDAVPLQPGPVLVEVEAGRADQDRAGAELAHAEGDVRGHPAATHVEVVDQEGQRDRVQLVRDELVGEPAGEGHEVVGGDGAGDCDAHGVDSPEGGGLTLHATGWERPVEAAETTR